MRVTRHSTGAALLEHAGPFLEASDAENGLLLGIAAAPSPSSDSPALWMSVDDGSALV